MVFGHSSILTRTSSEDTDAWLVGRSGSVEGSELGNKGCSSSTFACLKRDLPMRIRLRTVLKGEIFSGLYSGIDAFAFGPD